MMIDANISTLIQNEFLHHINVAFSTIAQYAQHLLYIFAVFEITIFGLAWALQQSTAWEQLFFKIIKITLIFFIVSHYHYLLNTLLNSFSQISQTIANTDQLSNFAFNPAHLWQFAYSAGLSLLKAASLANGFALPLIEVLLGSGILLVFALLGAQIVIQLVGFYFAALGSLILLPLGTFQLTNNMFEQSISSVLKAGIRLMVLLSIVGIAVNTWQSFHLHNFDPNQSINPSLGLFFSGLLFLCLSVSLPKLAAQTVGRIQLQRTSTPYNYSNHAATSHQNTANNHQHAVTAATQLANRQHNITSTTLNSSNHASNTHHHSNIKNEIIKNQPSSMQIKFQQTKKSKQDEHFSEEDIEKIKKAFMEILKERDKQHEK